MEPPGPTAPHWDASGKPAGVYQYRVRSCLTLCGNPSAIVTETVTGGGGGQAPGAPTMNPPGAGSNTGQIALSWSPAANPSPQPDYYMVQENGGYNIHVPSGTSLSLTRGNGTFTYKVRGCRNNPGHPANPFCGTFSDPVTVTVNASSIPAVPTGVRTDPQRECPGPRTATYAIRWNTSPGATRYELTETNDNDATTSTDTNAVSPKSFTHSVPVGLDSITYSYTVRACSASGCSQDSAATFACMGVLNQPNGPDSAPIATAYDAFGKVRNGDYSDRPGGKLNLLPDTVRGFTGHQHVDDVRLIHMNGRVYDYQLGRFLSVDPIIQFPANSQSLNPYSYIMNNPLSGRDPSGYAVSSDDQIGHGVTTGVRTIYDLDTAKAAYAENMASWASRKLGNGAEGFSATGAGNLKNQVCPANQKGSVANTPAMGNASAAETPLFQRTYEKMSQGNIAERFTAGFVASFGEVVGSFMEGDSYGGKRNFVTGEYIYPQDAKFNRISAIGTLAVPEAKMSQVLVRSTAKGEVSVFRVFGGDARAQGFSWTTKDPRTVSNFRDVAGLPSGGPSGATNTADFLIQGRVNATDIIKSRSALPLDGNKGGLPELIIDPKNVEITDFSILNP